MKNDTTLVSAAVSGVDSPGQVLDFTELFNVYMAQNQKVWAHDRRLTVGASEVWSCLRKVWFDKRGHEFGFTLDDDYEQNWGAMERGNLIENFFVVPALRLALPRMPSLPEGVELLLAGSDQITLVLNKNSSTADGVIKGLRPGSLTVRGGDQEVIIPDIKADCVILEIKSIDPRVSLLEEKAKHHGQTQVQLGLIRELTEHKPFYSIVLYVNASFLSNVTPFVVEFDPKMYETAKTRAQSVWAVDDPMMVVPEGRFNGDCEHCPWRGPCGTATLNSIPKVKESDPATVKELDPLVAAYNEAKAAFEAAEKKYEGAKEAIKELLLDHQTSAVAGSNYKVTWFPVKGRQSLDTKALAEVIDLTPFYREGQGHDQLRVTLQLESKRKEKRAS